MRLAERVLSPHGMPRSSLAARALLAAHVSREAFRAVKSGAALGKTLRRVLGDALLLEITARNFGTGSMIRGPHGLFPHIFMPDYHGPHFEEAVKRAVFPGRGPNIVYFSVTGVCPCHCEYCFAGAGGDERSDLGDEAVLRVARALAEQRIPLVNLSGGEPLSRFTRLVKVVRALSSGCEVRMFTTGIGLTRERLAELQGEGLKGLFVSLDGDDPARFDAVRGLPGSFDAARAGLKLAASRDVLTFVNAVVGRQAFPTVRAVERYLRFVESIDPRIVVNFLPQLATGRGADADSFAAPADCEPVAERIVSTARRLGRPITMLFGRVDTFMGCVGAGGKLLNIDIAGNVTVCISRAAVGNVLEEPFEQIYRRFTDQCSRLKVGFFCCKVGEAGSGEVLPPARSQDALGEFYAEKADSTWQRILDTYGPLLKHLYPP